MTNNQTDFRALCAELLEIIDFLCEGDARPDCDIVTRVRAALAQPEPTLTVQGCNDMPKHRFNFLVENRPGEIVLDGSFTREDLIEIANTVPPTKA